MFMQGCFVEGQVNAEKRWQPLFNHIALFLITSKERCLLLNDLPE
jgi:hypothetical protein